jgi:hypothetical protein
VGKGARLEKSEFQIKIEFHFGKLEPTKTPFNHLHAPGEKVASLPHVALLSTEFHPHQSIFQYK